MSRDLSLLESETRARCEKLLVEASTAGFPVVVVQTYRSSEEQA